MIKKIQNKHISKINIDDVNRLSNWDKKRLLEKRQEWLIKQRIKDKLEIKRIRNELYRINNRDKMNMYSKRYYDNNKKGK